MSELSPEQLAHLQRRRRKLEDWYDLPRSGLDHWSPPTDHIPCTTHRHPNFSDNRSMDNHPSNDRKE
jgi:hypothetical protein